jgi:hypothetical protein
MGIKNIHIMLISASSLILGLFGFWGLNNNFQLLGYLSILITVCLVIYGIQFIKKTKTL